MLSQGYFSLLFWLYPNDQMSQNVQCQHIKAQLRYALTLLLNSVCCQAVVKLLFSKPILAMKLLNFVRQDSKTDGGTVDSWATSGATSGAKPWPLSNCKKQ